ncbi:MAG: GNAT family N-acetyltransferase [Verrucomicrobia bacterium]|nr:GNAT family N-acetyltransferase [Verrucomicrobiota bacterium]MBU1908464.1 GNAT family N-acetyltransferase [Verrucomicrobiota bacterium]
MSTQPLQVALVPFSKDHVAQTFRWVSDPDLRRTFLIRGVPTWEGHLAYSDRVLADSSQKVFAILAAGQHVGNCGFKHLEPAAKRGEQWLYVGDRSWRGRGVGKAAAEVLLQEGFQALGLELIYLHVADFNEPARRLYERLGFVEVPLQDPSGEWQIRGFRMIRMELRKPRL